ncbi:MAG TPA: hypothetical protein VFP98_09980 [Candidatus Polarisedimenticolia bacterium]|nr:hypothetical protein [Candidatus Polarisedimenticolia bacterium]
MKRLRFDLHGLSISIGADDADLHDFIKAHFEAEKGDAAEGPIRIEAGWRWGRREAAREAAPGNAWKAGRGLTLIREETASGAALRAVWTRVPDFPELTMTLGLEGDDLLPRLAIGATCAYEPRGLGRRLEYLRPGRVDRKRNRLFFKMMYFMVYYPVAWYFERTRGWGLLHASSVTMPSGRAVILSGLGGVGKSTLALTLLSRPGARFLSDNLLFHDEERIYACPEPVRLDASALAGITDAGIEPVRTKLPLQAHPKPTYQVGAARRAASAAPAALYFLRFTERSSITPLDPGAAARMLEAGNDLAREIKDYRPCSALLTTLASERDGPPESPRASLARLLESVPCAVVGIGRGETPSRTASRLMERTEAAV